VDGVKELPLERLSRVFREIAQPTWESACTTNDSMRSHSQPLPNPFSASHKLAPQLCIPNNPSILNLPATRAPTHVPILNVPVAISVTSANHPRTPSAPLEFSNPGGPCRRDRQGERHVRAKERRAETRRRMLNPPKVVFQPPPSLDVSRKALKDISAVVSPKQKAGVGYNSYEEDKLLRTRMMMMKMFLWFYTDQSCPVSWMVASIKAAHAYQKSTDMAKRLRQWTRSFIEDRANLPINLYGSWSVSLLDKSELAQELHLYLQGIGKNVKAMDIVNFLADPSVQKKHQFKNTISLSTAQRWMHAMDYRWWKGPTGQYVDGHERADVVEYRQTKFLPTMAELEWSLRAWKDGIHEIVGDRPVNKRTVVWYHDESTFYANDRRKVYWSHSNETAKPRTKGEGASLMVADFISADYGWLRAPDGSAEARWIFAAGQNRDGYFTNAEILEHATRAMDILDQWYPHENHVLVFDNATTHLKRAEDALSARYMSLKPTAEGKPLWGVWRNVVGSNGRPVRADDGKLIKRKVPMDDARFPDGRPQPLYFPPGHPRAGVFKGMRAILEERGFNGLERLKASCEGTKFKCPKGAERCCVRRILYDQPDFRSVKSLLEGHCEARQYRIVFLPKFHCELNFIEQCWGYAKRIYRNYPPSTRVDDVRINMIKALDSIPIATIRRCDLLMVSP
jgi:hypothetical protein